jgi:hypothetical protein
VFFDGSHVYNGYGYHDICDDDYDDYDDDDDDDDTKAMTNVMKTNI